MITAQGFNRQGCRYGARKGGPHSVLLTHLIVMVGQKGGPRPDEEILFYCCTNHMPEYVKADVEFARITGKALFRVFKLAQARMNLSQLRRATQ